MRNESHVALFRHKRVHCKVKAKQWHLKSHVVFKGSKQYLISTLEYLIDDAHYIFTVNISMAKSSYVSSCGLVSSHNPRKT